MASCKVLGRLTQSRQNGSGRVPAVAVPKCCLCVYKVPLLRAAETPFLCGGGLARPGWPEPGEGLGATRADFLANL